MEDYLSAASDFFSYLTFLSKAISLLRCQPGQLSAHTWQGPGVPTSLCVGPSVGRWRPRTWARALPPLLVRIPPPVRFWAGPPHGRQGLAQVKALADGAVCKTVNSQRENAHGKGEPRLSISLVHRQAKQKESKAAKRATRDKKDELTLTVSRENNLVF